MFRMSLILVAVIAVTLCTFVTPVFAGVNTKPDPQFILTAKGTYDLGQGYSFIGKGVFFMADNLVQPWGYVQVNKQGLTFSGVSIASYRDAHAYSVAAKVKIRLKTELAENYWINQGGHDIQMPGNYWETTHEYYQIFYDRDFFYWGEINYNFKFDYPRGHQFFAGLYWELSNSDLTRLQIGPHVGIGDFEVALLLGEGSSAVRCVYTIEVK